jgi:alcohol dehydrogenase
LTGVRPIVLDLSRQRLEFCRRVMRVEHTLQPSDKLEPELRELIGGHLPDVVFDATGNSQSMSAAFSLVAPGGRLVFVGITTDEVRFRHPTFHRPEGTLICSRNALPGDFMRIIELIETGELDTQPWITHHSVLDDLPEAFPTYLRPESGVVKAMVEVGPD